MPSRSAKHAGDGGPPGKPGPRGNRQPDHRRCMCASSFRGTHRAGRVAVVPGTRRLGPDAVRHLSVTIATQRPSAPRGRADHEGAFCIRVRPETVSGVAGWPVRHAAPGRVAPMASTRPRCASEVTSWTLVRPRAVRSRKNPSHPAPSSAEVACRPRISRCPSAFTPKSWPSRRHMCHAVTACAPPAILQRLRGPVRLAHSSIPGGATAVLPRRHQRCYLA